METQTTPACLTPRIQSSSSLRDLVSNITNGLHTAAYRSKSTIINNIPENISVNINEELLIPVLSNLMNLVIMHTENSHIRISAKLFGNVVLVHVKDDGCLNYDSISWNLTKIQSLAEKLGGFVGFTSYRNKLTTIAFSFMNIPAGQPD